VSDHQPIRGHPRTDLLPPGAIAGQWETVIGADGVMIHVRWSLPTSGGEYLYVGHYENNAWGRHAVEREADELNRSLRCPWEFPGGRDVPTHLPAPEPSSDSPKADPPNLKISRRGVTRLVLLVGPWAIKAPRLNSWRQFLWGLLANLQEAEWSRTRWPQLCPVLWSIPGGLLLVMRRAHELTADEFAAFDVDAFRGSVPGATLPVENKRDSFGWLNGRVVAVDYGGPTSD
jgi:hypothetical protein